MAIADQRKVPEEIVPEEEKVTTIVLVTGGFDPIHSGHIEYFKQAKEMGNMLVVGCKQ